MRKFSLIQMALIVLTRFRTPNRHPLRLRNAFFVFALAGCNGAPLSTMWKLRHFDLGTADISKLRIGLRPPEWTKPTPENALLEATLRSDKEEGGERKLKIHLQRGHHPDDAAEIAHLAQDTRTFAIYEVAQRDLAAVRAFQENAQKLKREGASGKSGVKIQSGVACRGEVPQGPILIDVYIHADDESGWLPLLERYDLRPSLTNDEARRAFDEAVPSC